MSSLSLSCSPFLTDPTTPASPRALADMGRDGKMDRLEFSIAMKLIKLQLQGQPLPSSLPVIMKQTPAPAMTSSARFGKARPIVWSSSEFGCRVLIYSHHQKNSCTQKEVWECGGVGKEDKGDQDQ